MKIPSLFLSYQKPDSRFVVRCCAMHEEAVSPNRGSQERKYVQKIHFKDEMKIPP